MEKRRRGLSLTGLLWRYLAVAGTGMLLLTAVWWMGLNWLMSAGFIRRADSGAMETEAAVRRIEEAGGILEPEKLSYLCRYAVFDPQGNVTLTNMGKRQLAAAVNARNGGSGNPGLMQYHRAVPLADGSLCLLQYDYAVPYADPTLQEKLPDFQISYLLLLLLLAVLYAAAVTRRYTRILKKDAAALTEAGTAIAQGRLDLEPGRTEKARVRELDEAMQAIRTLRDSLKQSLQEQWGMQQQRTAEIAALAHDLKTPLSVISGNAELLQEEELAEREREPVEAILRNTLRAQTYLNRLQKAAMPEIVSAAAPEQIELQELWQTFTGIGVGLCAPKRIRFAAMEAPQLTFAARREELERALSNLLDNAVRYTPSGGRICISVEKAEHKLVFLVQDGGPGFSGEALVKAGTAFFREEASRPGDGHLGLGLYTARRTAAAHGGELILKNTESGGLAAFSIIVSGAR